MRLGYSNNGYLRGPYSPAVAEDIFGAPIHGAFLLAVLGSRDQQAVGGQVLGTIEPLDPSDLSQDGVSQDTVNPQNGPEALALRALGGLTANLLGSPGRLTAHTIEPLQAARHRALGAGSKRLAIRGNHC